MATIRFEPNVPVEFANLVWMFVNLRVQGRVRKIEARVTARIDELKEWMDKRYVAGEHQGCEHRPAASSLRVITPARFRRGWV
jgi:hypothetical protein